MSEDRALLVAMTQRLLGDRCDKALLDRCRETGWDAALWETLVEAGLTAPATPEALGGAGADLGDALALFRLCGQAALPVPLVETALANWLLGQCGLPASTRPVALAPTRFTDEVALRTGTGGPRLSFRLGAVAWAGPPALLVLVAEAPDGPRLCLVEPPPTPRTVTLGMAGEPRAVLEAEALVPAQIVPLPAGLEAGVVMRVGAVARAMQMAGALERLLTLSVQYAGDRVQFGRPIAKFQAIQHALAALAGEAAATAAAAQGAAEAVLSPERAILCAAAKVRAGEAATAATSIAHQIHGAMGFTAEHILHHFTRRLWAWRDEFGTEAEWARIIGRDLLAPTNRESGGLWSVLAA